MRSVSPTGEAQRGDRIINEGQAAIVREIFESYAKGHSPRAIARDLNRRHVPGPADKAWGPSTIHGNPSRGIGILNYELYVGELVWNRQRFIKDPESGKRVSRHNPESEWVRAEVPHLRLVSQELWDEVRPRKASAALGPQDQGAAALNKGHRPKYLLWRRKVRTLPRRQSAHLEELARLLCRSLQGTCDNRLNIRVEALEGLVLDGLKHHLMDPTLFEDFCAEFTREVNKVLIERGASLAGQKAELERVTRELDRTIDAILAGAPAAQLKDRMHELEARKSQLQQIIGEGKEVPALLHPSMAET